MRSSLLKSLFVALVLGALTADSLLAQPVQVISYNSTWKYNDAGMDLGTAWREPGFNDASWASGAGALGFPPNENLLGLATVQTPINEFVGGSTRIRTHYFRIKFQWNQTPQGVTLRSTNLVDDGAVFYLNGLEVGRLAMQPSTIVYTSFSTRNNDIASRGAEELLLPATSLIQGENVLAVEVHQGGGSNDDAIMAMSLWIEPPAAGPARVTMHPQSQATTPGVPVTFTVGVEGTPPFTFQWRKNGVDIPGANGQSYTISNPSLADPGQYTVFVSNALGSDVSNPAFLGVIAQPIHLIRWNHVWKIEDTATDLGTGWRANNYNDASWRSGPGPLGFETAVIAVPVATATADNNQLTTYFRSTFTFTNEPLDVSLTFTNLVDDGMTVYINEQEVLRVGMPAGQPTFGTAAGRTVGEAALETAIIPAEVLVQGVNRIAVEAHQVNTTSSDLVMGLTLTANFLVPTAISITNQPQDLAVEELKPAVFEAGITGNSPRYQWYKDGQPIMGANARRYAISAVDTMDQGDYRLVVSNPINSVTSRVARLTVLADTNGPVLLKADGTLNFTNIIVSFNESLQASSATTTANYVLSNVTMGATLAISSAVLTNATNVVLTTAARVAQQNYLLFARNIRDINPRMNVIAPNSVVPVTSLLRLILPTESWYFYDPIPPFDPPITGTAWRQASFDPEAAGWGQGPGGFVYDLNNQDLPIERGTILSQGSTSKYFWKTFEYRGSPAGADLRLRHVIDDGAIFYLNGQELIRFNMPPADGVPVDGDTPASAGIGAASFIDESVPAGLLNFGENVIAVEVHGTAPNDQDWVFSLELQGLIDSYATGAVLIARHPLSQTATEGQPVTFDFRGVGGSRFQWQRNGANIPGATNATYVIPAAPLAWNGSTFRVMVSNTTGSRTSDNATLTVVSDGESPVLLSAFGNGNQVTANFSEALNMSSAVTLANYRITNSAGMRNISAARLTNGNQVVLTTATPAQVGDVLIVNNVIDNSMAGNVIQANSAVTVGFEGILLPIGAIWRYNADNQNLGTAWREFGYNDTSWMSGPALLGQEGSSLPVILRTPVPAPGSGGPITTYYRTHFNFPAAPAGAMLSMRIIIDDGAVFFLNGEEFYRIGVPAGEGFGTVANRTVDNAVWEGPINLTLPSLRAGDNVLAVANHQINTGSSDLVTGVELSMDAVPSMVLTPPPVDSFLRIILLANGMVRVEWGGDGFILEGAPSLNSPIDWTAVQNQPKPYEFTPTPSGMRFFRLKR